MKLRNMSDRILIIDDDEALRESLELVLGAEGYEVHSAPGAEAALAEIEATSFDAILCDLRMPDVDGMELLPQLIERVPETPVVMMSAYGTDELALEAIQQGACDYLAKPFQPAEAAFTLRKARERDRLRRENRRLRKDVTRVMGDVPIVATSEAMIEVLELMERAAAFKTTVLIMGETGTGKEVLARAVHAQSPRRNSPFIAVNCGAIPEALLESQLFGHARGAFTGANRANRGLVREADGGTLFLDEIGELAPPLQVKLLRMLQEEEVLPLGENRPRSVDVRVIAATSRDLEQEVIDGGFRKDLFYRLDVVRLMVPPLRERPKDIPLLLDHFMQHYRTLLGRDVRGISDLGLECLVRYPWQGNVRELENVIERAIILTENDIIGPRELPANLVTPAHPRDGSGPDLRLKRARRQAETEVIQRALRATGGNRTHAAQLLEISHRALLYKIKDYGIRD